MASDLDNLTSAIATVQIDNEHVKATRWHFPPGSETGWHKHAHDYVVVPTIAGTLTIVELDDSRREVPYIVAETYGRPLGAEHNVINLSNRPVEFVEIELK